MNTSCPTLPSHELDIGAFAQSSVALHVDSSQYSFAGLGRLNVDLKQPTVNRLEKMQSLVAAMKNREMSLDEIQRFLKFSDTGARKYLKRLREVGIIEESRYVDASSTSQGRLLFKVTTDPARLQMGFRRLTEQVTKAASQSNTAAKSRLGKDESGNARHFYIMADDEKFSVKLSRHRVVRDPLVAALFGPAASSGSESKSSSLLSAN